MKKNLLLLIIAAFSTFIMVFCKEDVILANPDGTGKTNNPGGTNGSTGSTGNITGCIISEMGEGEEKKNFNYSDKNLLLSEEDNYGKSTFEYDANNRIVKISYDASGIETFTYEYDSKGNISKARYSTEGNGFFSNIREMNYSTNAKGQVDKIQAITDENEKSDFLFEYDAKNNIKKVMVSASGIKETLIENVSFDDKQNLYTNTNLAKAYLAHTVLGAIFGANGTVYCNTNNVTSDKTLDFFSESFFGSIWNKVGT